MSVNQFNFDEVMKVSEKGYCIDRKYLNNLVASHRKFLHYNKCVCNVEIDCI